MRHRKLEIYFDEDSEQWKCADLALASASLKTVKASIDKAMKERRRVSVPALHLEDARFNSHVAAMRTCIITSIREDERKADVRFGKEHEVVYVRNLYAIDEQKKIEAYIEATKIVQAAHDRAEKLEDDLTHMTAEAIREAVAKSADDSAGEPRPRRRK